MNVESYWEQLWFKLVTLTALGGVGGLLSYVMRQYERDKPVLVSMAVVKFLSSGFTALVVSLVCKAMHLDDAWTAVACGVFGWLGAEVAFNALERIIERQFGITITPEHDYEVNQDDDGEHRVVHRHAANDDNVPDSPPVIPENYEVPDDGNPK